ncbi:MAG: hypothetical protein ACLFN8_04055 [Candidatus Woesearchaeota archaeon]
MKQETIEKLKKLTNKKYIIFMNKCREAAELIMRYAKKTNYDSLILQEEGGWHTYEKSAKKIGLNVLFAKMNEGQLIKQEFPQKKALIIINTNPGYAYTEPLKFYDELKKTQSLIINDVVGSIGEDTAKKGDYLIGSFGKDKPLTISTGGAFIALNDENTLNELLKIKQEYYRCAGEQINFNELNAAIDNLENKKNNWINHSNKIKKELKTKGYTILNQKPSINIFVEINEKTNTDERENLIKFCNAHNLEYQKCPLYIRTIKNAISIEIKKIKR